MITKPRVLPRDPEAVLIDRVGRRKLALASLLGITVSMLLLGGAFSMQRAGEPKIVSFDEGCYAESCDACTHLAACAFCMDDRGHTGSCVNISKARLSSPVVFPSDESCDATQLYTEGCPSRYTAYVMVSILLYLGSFAPGMGPVPWAVNAEIFPDCVRGQAMGVSTFSNWAVNMLVSEAFPILLDAIGGAWTFTIHAAVAVIGFGLVFRYLPETNGMSLSEIQSLLATRAGGGAHPPRSSRCLTEHSRKNDGELDGERTRLLSSTHVAENT